jgi:transcriptional regulator with XRE-family HTH domain
MYKIIESLCKEKNIRISQLCNVLGISNSTFTELKSGRTQQLSAKNAAKVAGYFGVSIDYLMGETDQKKKPLADEDEELNELLEELKNRSEMRMLFKLAKGATKADVEQAVRIIEALRKPGSDD